jgi:hypothetical protein
MKKLLRILLISLSLITTVMGADHDEENDEIYDYIKNLTFINQQAQEIIPQLEQRKDGLFYLSKYKVEIPSFEEILPREIWEEYNASFVSFPALQNRILKLLGAYYVHEIIPEINNSDLLNCAYASKSPMGIYQAKETEYLCIRQKMLFKIQEIQQLILSMIQEQDDSEDE